MEEAGGYRVPPRGRRGQGSGWLSEILQHADGVERRAKVDQELSDGALIEVKHC